MVGMVGFEPTAPCPQNKASRPLNYIPISGTPDGSRTRTQTVFESTSDQQALFKPDGSRTRTQTVFETAASSSWATGVYIGWEGRNRTLKLRIQSAMALPVCLLPNKWLPQYDLNLQPPR